MSNYNCKVRDYDPAKHVITVEGGMPQIITFDAVQQVLKHRVKTPSHVIECCPARFFAASVGHPIPAQGRLKAGGRTRITNVIGRQLTRTADTSATVARITPYSATKWKNTLLSRYLKSYWVKQP